MALLLLIVLNINAATFFLAAYIYISVRPHIGNIARLYKRIMELEEVLNSFQADQPVEPPQEKPEEPQQQLSCNVSDDIQNKRSRLAAIVAGGNAHQYLGRAVTLSEIDSLPDKKIHKLYSTYEARLGADITKTLGKTAIQIYSMLACSLLPIPAEREPMLSSDLANDPFVNHALTTACCELYHSYGAYLAPLTTALTTAKHCQFRGKKYSEHIDGGEHTDPDGGDTDPQEPREPEGRGDIGGACTDSGQ